MCSCKGMSLCHQRERGAGTRHPTDQTAHTRSEGGQTPQAAGRTIPHTQPSARANPGRPDQCLPGSWGRGRGRRDPCEGLGFLWGMARVPHVGNALEATWLRTVESLKWWILYSVNFTLMKKTHKADREIGMQYSPASQGHIKSRWGLILKQVGIQ